MHVCALGADARASALGPVLATTLVVVADGHTPVEVDLSGLVRGTSGQCIAGLGGSIDALANRLLEATRKLASAVVQVSNFAEFKDKVRRLGRQPTCVDFIHGHVTAHNKRAIAGCQISDVANNALRGKSRLAKQERNSSSGSMTMHCMLTFHKPCVAVARMRFVDMRITIRLGEKTSCTKAYWSMC